MITLSYKGCIFELKRSFHRGILWECTGKYKCFRAAEFFELWRFDLSRFDCIKVITVFIDKISSNKVRVPDMRKGKGKTISTNQKLMNQL